MSAPRRGSSRFKGYEKPKVEEKFDWADTVRRQIERCLMSAQDEYAFPRNVLGLESLLPEELRDDEYEKDFDKSVHTFTRPRFVYCLQTKVGSVADPRMLIPGADNFPLASEVKDPPYLKDEEGNLELDDEGNPQINWSDPRIYSPHMVEEEEINWFNRLAAAVNQFARLGVAIRRVSRG